MERDSSEKLSEYKNSLDRVRANVMPDKWEGHGRIAIRESEAVPASVEETAIEKMNKLVNKKGKSPEKAANDLIRAVQKKRQEK